MSRFRLSVLVLGAFALMSSFVSASADFDTWEKHWPQTDFSRHSVDLSEIISGGMGRDVIPVIDEPEDDTAREGTDSARPPQ